MSLYMPVECHCRAEQKSAIVTTLRRSPLRSGWLQGWQFQQCCQCTGVHGLDFLDDVKSGGRMPCTCRAFSRLLSNVATLQKSQRIWSTCGSG